MLCWNNLSIVSKRAGSARPFADESSVIVATICVKKRVGKPVMFFGRSRNLGPLFDGGKGGVVGAEERGRKGKWMEEVKKDCLLVDKERTK